MVQAPSGKVVLGATSLPSKIDLNLTEAPALLAFDARIKKRADCFARLHPCES